MNTNKNFLNLNRHNEYKIVIMKYEIKMKEKERKSTSKVVQFKLLELELTRFMLLLDLFQSLYKETNKKTFVFLLFIIWFNCFYMTHSIPIVRINSTLHTTSTPIPISQTESSKLTFFSLIKYYSLMI